MPHRAIDRLFAWIADRWPFQSARLRLTLEQRAQIAATQKRREDALADPALSPLERLTFWWGELPAPGASDNELSALETRYTMRLPEDFRAYLKTVMPAGNDWDAEGTKWWPLSDLESVWEECGDWEGPSALDTRKLIVFADYLIWCYAWAIDCSDGEHRGRVAVINGHDRYVADSFDEFIDRYLRGESSIH